MGEVKDTKNILVGIDYENLHENFVKLWQQGFTTSKILKTLKERVYDEIAGAAREVALEQFAVFDLDHPMYHRAKRELNESVSVTQIRSAYNVHKGGSSDTGILQEFNRRLIVPVDRSKPDYIVLVSGDSDFVSWAHQFQSVNLKRKFFLIHNSHARPAFRENHVWAKTWNFDDIFQPKIETPPQYSRPQASPFAAHPQTDSQYPHPQAPPFATRAQTDYARPVVASQSVPHPQAPSFATHARTDYVRPHPEAPVPARPEARQAPQAVPSDTRLIAARPCKFFSLGTCWSGAECPFRHDLDESKSHREELKSRDAPRAAASFGTNSRVDLSQAHAVRGYQARTPIAAPPPYNG